MPKSETTHSFTREQIVAVFAQWTTLDIKTDRNGKVDAQAQTERFLDTSLQLFGNDSPADDVETQERG